jgi:hypothetical protein
MTDPKIRDGLDDELSDEELGGVAGGAPTVGVPDLPSGPIDISTSPGPVPVPYPDTSSSSGDGKKKKVKIP